MMRMVEAMMRMVEAMMRMVGAMMRRVEAMMKMVGAKGTVGLRWVPKEKNGRVRKTEISDECVYVCIWFPNNSLTTKRSTFLKNNANKNAKIL